MSNLDALVSVSQVLLRFRDQWKMEQTSIGDIVNAVWDSVNAFDIGDSFRNVANQAIRELERRAGLSPQPY